VVEVEDEHSEARYVAAEIAMLVEQGYSGREIAVFYRTNAQSRVLEDVLVRQGIAYQVIGGPRFYERAEVKDLIAYLQVIDNPYDAVSLLRAANRPRRGIGDSTLAKLMSFADDAEMSLWEAMDRCPAAGVGTGPAKAVAAFRTIIQSLTSAAQELEVPALVEQGIEEERRLCYVGMTRAMEMLTLMHASSRMLFGGRSYNLGSRFFDELPEAHVERDRLRPASWSNYGAPKQSQVEPRGDVPTLSTGDNVRHQSLGAGAVI